nr:hypothetical protein [uncultured Tolumonas sp.]
MGQINTNKNGLISTQDQALQSNKPNTTPIHDVKTATKICMMIMRSGMQGITGLGKYKIIAVSLVAAISRLN